MITTLKWGHVRIVVLAMILSFMTTVLILTAQTSADDRRDIRTRVEISAEKINSLEEWRRAIESTQIAPRLATLESQMETSTWLQRAMLGGIGALILEMLVRLLNKAKKE